MEKPQGEAVTWSALLDQWGLLESCFHSEFGVDLSKVWRSESWRWFRTRVMGLLASDTALSRAFAPEHAPPDQKQPEVDDGR